MIARSSALLAVAGLSLLVGCAKGPIRGQLTLPQQTPQPAVLSYESSVFGKTGTLRTTLPTGETFAGPYVLDPRAPDKTITSTLAGNRGNHMICKLTLSEPGIGPDKGGAVKCDLSTGGVFDARF
jgi:hypothetical protein